MWNSILAACFNTDLLHCLSQEWEEQIKDIINNRMQVCLQLVNLIAYIHNNIY